MIEQIEQRVYELEQRLFGGASHDDYPQIVDTLVKLNLQMNAAAVSQPNIDNLFQRLNELEKCIAIDEAELKPMTIETKLQMILPMKDNLLKNAEDLAQIDQLCEVLGSEHLKVMPSLASNLHKLSHIQLQLESDLKDVTDETNTLLIQYNMISDKIMEELIQLDEDINITKTKDILK